MTKSWDDVKVYDIELEKGNGFTKVVTLEDLEKILEHFKFDIHVLLMELREKDKHG